MLRKCRLFGKDYIWMRGHGGALFLCGDATFANVPQRYAMGPPSYGDLVEVLGKLEAEGGVRDARTEGSRRISLGLQWDGLSDPQGSRDAGRSGERVAGSERDQVARQEGHGEEGTGGQADSVLKRTCTSCWFDSHTGCAGPARCTCWVCYGGEDG